jgi:hypothetical protein
LSDRQIAGSLGKLDGTTQTVPERAQIIHVGKYEPGMVREGEALHAAAVVTDVVVSAWRERRHPRANRRGYIQTPLRSNNAMLDYRVQRTVGYAYAWPDIT